LILNAKMGDVNTNMAYFNNSIFFEKKFAKPIFSFTLASDSISDNNQLVIFITKPSKKNS